jgi:hypothetical protein
MLPVEMVVCAKERREQSRMRDKQQNPGKITDKRCVDGIGALSSYLGRHETKTISLSENEAHHFISTLGPRDGKMGAVSEKTNSLDEISALSFALAWKLWAVREGE